MVIHAEMEHCPAILRLGIRNHFQPCSRPGFSLWPSAVACPVQKAEQVQSEKLKTDQTQRPFL
jgi:hypothetical protein